MILSTPIIAGYVVDNVLPDVTREDAFKLTHVFVAFGIVVDGRVSVDHLQNLDHIDKIRSYNPAIKILLSIGGWGAGGFSEAAFTVDGRKQFAQSVAGLMEAYHFDGADIDWEYPCYGEAGIGSCPEDKTNFNFKS